VEVDGAYSRMTCHDDRAYGNDGWQVTGRTDVDAASDVDQWATDTWQFTGQMIGCHVAQSWAATWHPGIGLYFGWLIKMLCGRPDSNRRPPPPSERFNQLLRPLRHIVLLVKPMEKRLFELEYCVFGQGVGSGLGPDPRFYYMLRDRVLCPKSLVLIYVAFII
jgi:hypothetical protein